MRRTIALALIAGITGLTVTGLPAAMAAPAAPAAKAPEVPLPAGVRLLSDVTYLEPARAEKLDIYLPAPASAASAAGQGLPAVVYFHGGGWVRGDKAADRECNLGGNFAARGYVFVSVNYVLGPKAWPANLLDCKNAIRFIRKNAARYGVDPERIAAMGASAGGHLALMAAYTPDVAEFEPKAPYAGVSNRVRVVIDFYGMTNLLTRRVVEPDGTPTGGLMDSHAPEVLGVKRTEGAAVWKLASPVTHVAAGSPPTLIVHGLADPTVDYIQAVELANTLRAKGVVHDMLLLEGVGHMFHLDLWQEQALPESLKTTVFGFLARHLNRAELAVK
ncbi:MAG: alpha/beta hydrolase [Verrucomicrobiota bacterium]